MRSRIGIATRQATRWMTGSANREQQRCGGWALPSHASCFSCLPCCSLALFTCYFSVLGDYAHSRKVRMGSARRMTSSHLWGVNYFKIDHRISRPSKASVSIACFSLGHNRLFFLSRPGEIKRAPCRWNLCTLARTLIIRPSSHSRLFHAS